MAWQRANMWDPLRYLTPEELSQINDQFDHALESAICLVFWTGIPRRLVQEWADERGLKTLTTALGPIMDRKNGNSPRYRKKPKQWSKFMKGASGRYAEYACQSRCAVVLTNPPPNIYSVRKGCTYRLLEEPILKGLCGGPGTLRIDYVHPTVKGAADFRYQMWPRDQSRDWLTFVMRGLRQISAGGIGSPASVMRSVLPVGESLIVNALLPRREEQVCSSNDLNSGKQYSTVATNMRDHGGRISDIQFEQDEPTISAFCILSTFCSDCMNRRIDFHDTELFPDDELIRGTHCRSGLCIARCLNTRAWFEQSEQT